MDEAVASMHQSKKNSERTQYNKHLSLGADVRFDSVQYFEMRIVSSALGHWVFECLLLPPRGSS
jgi:hypothetical protein